MAKKEKNWTPHEIRNKVAEKWQGRFYFMGLVAGAISWANFSKHVDDAGRAFALIMIVAFGLGSLIKTAWVKHGQVNVYVKDKTREAFRGKMFAVGIVMGVVAVLALNQGAREPGIFLATLSAGLLLVGGLLPTKWVKRAEGAVYR